jgi:RNA recognition motif-containing protein
MTTIYCGNLPFGATEQDVRALFERHGKVESVKLVNDRETGKPRGFGFVEMAQNEAQGAIQALNGYQMNGRPLRINEAQERPQRPRQGGGPFRRSRIFELIFFELCEEPRSRGVFCFGPAIVSKMALVFIWRRVHEDKSTRGVVLHYRDGHGDRLYSGMRGDEAGYGIAHHNLERSGQRSRRRSPLGRKPRARCLPSSQRHTAVLRIASRHESGGSVAGQWGLVHGDHRAARERKRQVLRRAVPARS